MPHPTGLRLLLLVVILTALVTAPRDAYGEVASITLQKLSAQAQAIAIARVDKVQGIGGVRVATGSRHATAPISTTASVRRVRREVTREPSTV